jgi:UTP--glucose-1-phosphate uridylyltransferase
LTLCQPFVILARNQTEHTVQLKKAIVTAAGPNQRTLPLQTLVDRDGTTKSALRIILEEILKAGIEEVGVVIQPGDEAAYAAAAGDLAGRIRFLPQCAARGFGGAVHSARVFTADEPFLLLVGDHLYVSRVARNCAQQLVETARREGCAVSAVQATHESKLPYYGAVGGRLESGQAGLYTVEDVVEKPTPTEAERRLVVPGMRAGFYLCFFGMHVLTPLVMDWLEAHLGAGRPGGGGDASGGGASSATTGAVSLSDALAELAGRERYLALEVEGQRYDIGVPYGLLTAQLALAFEGQDRDEVLAMLVELLARRRSAA